MFYTLTMNPAIDMNVTGKNIEKNKVNRTHGTVYTPNGKGINVSIVLQHFGCQTMVLGFFGGFSGTYIIDGLKQMNVPVHPFMVSDPTRINTFINDGDDEFKIVNEGSFVGESSVEELLDFLKTFTSDDYIVITGSLPRGVDDSVYDRILPLLQQNGVKTVLDLSSQALKNAARYRPFLIKPNDDELREVFGYEVTDDESACQALKSLKDLGYQNVLLTMGAKGSYFSNGSEVWFCPPRKVKLLSSACAGDSALAAFISIYCTTGDIKTALKRSAATGANVAESNALGTLSNVEQYMTEIESRKIEDLK